jgi:hypothetical protein
LKEDALLIRQESERVGHQSVDLIKTVWDAHNKTQKLLETQHKETLNVLNTPHPDVSQNTRVDEALVTKLEEVTLAVEQKSSSLVDWSCKFWKEHLDNLDMEFAVKHSLLWHSNVEEWDELSDKRWNTRLEKIVKEFSETVRGITGSRLADFGKQDGPYMHNFSALLSKTVPGLLQTVVESKVPGMIQHGLKSFFIQGRNQYNKNKVNGFVPHFAHVSPIFVYDNPRVQKQLTKFHLLFANVQGGTKDTGGTKDNTIEALLQERFDQLERSIHPSPTVEQITAANRQVLTDMMMTEGNMFDQRLLKRINEPQAVVVDELQGNKALIAECKKAVEESKESIKKTSDKLNLVKDRVTMMEENLTTINKNVEKILKMLQKDDPSGEEQHLLESMELDRTIEDIKSIGQADSDSEEEERPKLKKKTKNTKQQVKAIKKCKPHLKQK